MGVVGNAYKFKIMAGQFDDLWGGGGGEDDTGFSMVSRGGFF